MPYATPNLTTLQQQALSDIQSARITDQSGNVVDGLLQKAVLRVLALVQAGFAYLHFRFLDYIALESVPYTSTDEWLAGWAALKGVTQKDATAATGTATFLVSAVSTIFSGTALSRSDGFAYVTTANTTSASGSTTITVPIAATLPGSGGTINAGVGMSLSSPIVGVNSNGTAQPVTPGTDQETQDSFKARTLAAYSMPPQGGSKSDYVTWANEVGAVTRAWCFPNGAGPGTVQVYFMEDNAEAAHGGFPQGTDGVATGEARNTGTTGSAPLATGDQLQVANYILPLQPVTALVYAKAPTPNPVSYTIAGLSPNTATIQAGIAAALSDMHRRVSAPGGTTRSDGRAGGTIYESDWFGAIISVPGIISFDVTSPSADVTSASGALPNFGGVTFV